MNESFMRDFFGMRPAQKQQMTLRDRFATAAMCAIIGKREAKWTESTLNNMQELRREVEAICRGAYLYADTMMKERSRGDADEH